MMFFLLQKEEKTSSETIYPNAMEARICYEPNLLTMFEETIA